MDELIKSEWEPYVFAYLNDMIIGEPTSENHIKWLEAVLEALKKANLQINLKKSEFCYAEVKYLGYIVNEDGLKVNEDKVRPFLEYPAPINLKQLRRFLGMISWYFRFIARLAEYSSAHEAYEEERAMALGGGAAGGFRKAEASSHSGSSFNKA